MSIFGHFKKKSKREPIRTVRAPRARVAVKEVVRNTVDVDPIFDDTGDLAIQAEQPDGGSPYDTQTWELDPREGLQRVDDSRGVKHQKGSKKEVDNPYDTSVTRKGWQ